MKFSFRNILAGAVLALLMSACQEVIDVDLDAADQQIVIEGIVTDQIGTHWVKITQSVPFDEPNQFPAVSGAQVTIADDNGLLDTLLEQTPGLYKTQKLKQGIAGHTYTLRVVTGGQTYTARSTMPAAVPFNQLTTDVFNFAGEQSYALVPDFTDPPGLGNFYHFTIYVNGKQKPDIFTFNDELSDGRQVALPLLNPDFDLKTGDTCKVAMFCLDETEYRYLLSLQLIAGNNPGGGSTPGNPENNFGGSCLGHFAAKTIQTKTLIVP